MLKPRLQLGGISPLRGGRQSALTAVLLRVLPRRNPLLLNLTIAGVAGTFTPVDMALLMGQGGAGG